MDMGARTTDLHPVERVLLDLKKDIETLAEMIAELGRMVERMEPAKPSVPTMEDLLK